MTVIDYETVAVIGTSLEEIRRTLGVDFESYWEDGLGWCAVSPLWASLGFCYMFREYLYSPLPGVEICLDLLDSHNGGSVAVDEMVRRLQLETEQIIWIREGYCSGDRSAYAAMEAVNLGEGYHVDTE